jgi:hypothetical protein
MLGEEEPEKAPMTPEEQIVFKFKNSSCVLLILTFLIVVSVIFEKLKVGCLVAKCELSSRAPFEGCY